MKSDHEDVKKTQGCAKQEIRDEVKDFVGNEVKIWKEEKEKDEIKRNFQRNIQATRSGT